MKWPIIGIVFVFFCTSYSTSSPHDELKLLMKRTELQRPSIEMLYQRWYSGPLHYLLTSKLASKAAGRWANSARSRRYIPRFIETYSIDTSEIAQPIRSFKSFNDFFVRTLKPGARPLPQDPAALISPADGSLLVIPHLSKDTMFPIKSALFSAEKVLGDPALAQLFEDGTAVIVRLAPWDYHHVHFPLNGIPTTARKIGGRLESVNPLVFTLGIQPFETNERHIIQLHTANANTVALILVGATFVGAIKETYMPGAFYQRGDTLGHFEFGGSTMVMLFQKDMIHINLAIVAASAEGKETPVKMGQVIGYIVS
jgi:phosphatidylserine decarboxylase